MVAVLGVDPSLRMTGLACSDGVHLYVHRISTPPTAATFASRLHRLQYIVRQVLEFAPFECMTLIEAPALAVGGAAGGLFLRAGLYWMRAEKLAERGPVVEVSPAQRAIYATGKGNATKEQVLESMRSRPPGITLRDDNMADALALAAMGARWLGRPFDGDQPAEVLRALTKVRWPDAPEPRPFQFAEVEEAL